MPYVGSVDDAEDLANQLATQAEELGFEVKMDMGWAGRCIENIAEELPDARAGIRLWEAAQGS